MTLRCDMIVFSLSRLVCHCPWISALKDDFESVVDQPMIQVYFNVCDNFMIVTVFLIKILILLLITESFLMTLEMLKSRISGHQYLKPVTYEKIPTSVTDIKFTLRDAQTINEQH